MKTFAKVASSALVVGLVAVSGMSALAADVSTTSSTGTNTASISAGLKQGKEMKDNRKAPAELTEAQKSEMLAKAKEELSQRLSDGSISQEQYNTALSEIESGKMPSILGKGGHRELTEAQKSEMLAKAKEELSQRLSDGSITQEQYNTALSEIESGKMPSILGKGGHRELTEAQKSEMLAKAKEELSQHLSDGSITQEQYDTALADIANGQMPRLHSLGIFGHEKQSESAAASE